MKLGHKSPKKKRLSIAQHMHLLCLRFQVTNCGKSLGLVDSSTGSITGFSPCSYNEVDGQVFWQKSRKDMAVFLVGCEKHIARRAILKNLAKI